jgi:hypothetical protein
MQRTLLFRVLNILFVVVPFLSEAQKRVASGSNAQILPNASFVELNNTCDSIGWRPPSNHTLFARYPLDDNEGFISGTNDYGDLAKGNFFDLSGTTANFLLRAVMGLGEVNTKAGGDLTRAVPVRAYDGTSNAPGSLIGTYNANLEEMVLRGFNFTLVTFPSAIPLPASKKIFLMVDISNLLWLSSPDPAANDTLTLLSTLNNEPAVPLAWEQWNDNSWHTVESSWTLNGVPLKINHHLYPLISATADGCTLPVTFGQFTAKQSQLGVDLKWQTWTETNNDRFEVQKSNDGQKFLTIGSVKSKAINGEHQGFKSYQFTDPTPGAGANFYRIRQVDKDGAYTFTKTVKVTINAGDENQVVRTYYPNPAHDRMFIQLANGIREVESLMFMDASGKVLISQKPAVTPDGLLNISTSGLRSGLNFAILTLPDGRQTTIKVMKD